MVNTSAATCGDMIAVRPEGRGGVILACTQPRGDHMTAPLVDREMGCTAVPSTWCVVACEQGCTETWTVDVTDFEPKLTADDVERLLTPLLIAHEVEHGKW